MLVNVTKLRELAGHPHQLVCACMHVQVCAGVRDMCVRACVCFITRKAIVLGRCLTFVGIFTRSMTGLLGNNNVNNIAFIVKVWLRSVKAAWV